MVLLVLGIKWAHGKADSEVCTAVDVEVLNSGNTSFVTPEGVKAEMTRMGLMAAGLTVRNIDINKIETKLRQSEYLENVECFMAANGHLVIRVEQIVPVLRVFETDSTSYYLNRNGKRLNATYNFHADVPIVSGHFTRSFPATRLLPLVEYIEKDATLHSLVTMIDVVDSSNIYIIPNIEGHVVNFGSVDNYENKFKKLLTFYKEVLPYKGYYYYDTISVKWNYQIVATKSNKAVKEQIKTDPDDDEGDSPFSNVTDTPLPNEGEKAQEPAKADEKKKADSKPKADEKKKADEPKKADNKPKADEPKKKADEKKKADSKPKADEKKKTDVKAKANEAKKGDNNNNNNKKKK